MFLLLEYQASSLWEGMGLKCTPAQCGLVFGRRVTYLFILVFFTVLKGDKSHKMMRLADFELTTYNDDDFKSQKAWK